LRKALKTEVHCSVAQDSSHSEFVTAGTVKIIKTVKSWLSGKKIMASSKMCTIAGQENWLNLWTKPMWLLKML